MSTTSSQAIAVQNDLRWLQQAIKNDPSCAGWLTNGAVNSDTAINFELGVGGTGFTGMMVGVGSFDMYTVNAVAGTVGTNLTPGSMLITVNLEGAFFNPGPSSFVGYGVPSWIKGGTAAAQALILLHELAHNIGAAGFKDDGKLPSGAPNVGAQTANNKLVLEKCEGIINLFGGP